MKRSISATVRTTSLQAARRGCEPPRPRGDRSRETSWRVCGLIIYLMVLKTCWLSSDADHPPHQLQIFGRVHADRAVGDGDDFDLVAVFQRAKLLEHFALFEGSWREFRVGQEKIA